MLVPVEINVTPSDYGEGYTLWAGQALIFGKPAAELGYHEGCRTEKKAVAALQNKIRSSAHWVHERLTREGA